MIVTEEIIDKIGGSNIDIFVPENNYRIIDQSPQDSDEKRLVDAFVKLDKIYDNITKASERLISLSKLFKVIKRGDDLDRQYQVCFNCSEETNEDMISEIILDSFIKDNGLNITSIVDNINELKIEIEARLLRDNPPYCEVDLLQMTDKKEPVEC